MKPKFIKSGFSYKGYVYQPFVDIEPDVMKTFHDVQDPNGKAHYIDWSPYSGISDIDFQSWIDLGMPKRVGHSSLNSLDLMNLMNEKRNT